MKTIERIHSYNGLVRTENRTEEIECYEDFLLLSNLALEAAKAAYSLEHCPEDKKKDGEQLLHKELDKLKEQFELCNGYFGGKNE